MGTIKYALVAHSTRLQRVVELLKAATNPLSGMEIQIQAWVTNASTSIAEIRCERNREAGYMVSPATSWRGGREPWHDGNPRYWLLAAPGWTPRWSVDAEGFIFPYTDSQGLKQGARTAPLKPETQVRQIETVAARLCRFCGAPVNENKRASAEFCGDACRAGWWRRITEIGKGAAAGGRQ